MTSDDAQPGDVVMTEDGSVYQAPVTDGGGWSHMQPVGFYGDPAGTAPSGPLVLLARDGRKT